MIRKSMITKLGFMRASIALILISSNNVSAFQIVDNYCNEQAKLGSWTVGIGEKKNVSNIMREFDNEHQRMILALDKLPVKLTETVLFSSIGSKPNSVIRIMKEHARYQWDVTGKKSNLSVTIQYYKGCINQISLMDTNKMNFYNRYNVLSTKP